MNIINRIKCAICNNELTNLYNLNNMPIKLTCTDSFNLKNSEISWSQCNDCNTIQLDKLIPLDILYSGSHNYSIVGKTWENYFKFFSNKIYNIVDNKNILEIGDPSAKIANKLNNYNQWFIVEPNKNNNIKFNNKISFIDGFFDEHFTISNKVDVIIHSHLFEHIYEPNIFLKKCYEVLDDNGEMFFSVPNMEYILEKELSAFLGVFFEHTIFYNKENIIYLLNKNNFEIIEIIDYENHSIMYHVKKIIKTNNVFFIDNIKIKNYKDIFFNTLNKYIKFINDFNNSILKTECYIVGASYNTQFILALGLNINKLNGIIDNCKEKQGKYLYGFNLKIYDPSILIDKKDISIIIKNGYYVNEICDQIKSLNTNVVIII